ncbi:MAG: glycosidase [Aeromonadaceae bacterium]|nr:glycosidase [Aeromonadaceae bacterium]
MNQHFWRRSAISVAMALALTACGGGGGGDEKPPVDDSTYTVTISSSAHTADSRMTCNQGADVAACDLRMYQIMVEAYVNGDDSINYDTGYGPSKHKGDLQGIVDSLDYIAGTGVNAIWLTPIFDSCKGKTNDAKLEATGYYACDYFTVDPMFGDNAKLKELVDAAHAKGLYVFLDGVFGHASGIGVTMDNLPASLSGLAAPVTAASVANKHDTCVESDTTICFDYSQPDTLAFFKAVAAHYVTEYGIDGWRLDQAYQVPISAWEEIRDTVETAAADRKAAGEEWGTLGYMVGEVWDGNQNNFVSKVYGTAANPGLQSAFDFPLHYGLMQAIGSETSASSNGDASKLYANWNDGSVYPDFAMPNIFIGNHDIPRLGDLLQRTGRGDVNADEYWLRHKATFSFMAATSGPMTFYYGEEIGDQLDGFAAQVTTNCASQGLCDDHVARTDGKVAGVTGHTLSSRQSNLKAYLKSLMDLRDAHPALAQGTLTRISDDSNVFVSRKDNGGDQILYLLNTQAKDAKITLSTSALGDDGTLQNLLDSGDSISASEGNYTITVPAYTGLFYQIN